MLTAGVERALRYAIDVVVGKTWLGMNKPEKGDLVQRECGVANYEKLAEAWSVTDAMQNPFTGRIRRYHIGFEYDGRGGELW